ncbi:MULTISPECIES: YaaR family protein [unclassified Candidatus Frackibacter]|uniref:YaaR family protein n=1 Tax=unclassified Candidatus Frackibacter TaxID=2648818 RepID=UPI0007936B8F|nr:MULTISPECIES: YaaR family protein [unclassified Candidatus Frackibacter]KXS45829.1 MAG: hypothetical protein AWU54_120 [Candidatus Frackibacter sp. T328-2]SDC54409.1 hypothetical protein SAMN04515661_11344 [Candidatus Frackibacter sp. WG11]SEM66606.1 hypothetical protein SAMN04488698_11144 [Candidatus Frackibacter sp. WG12]SFL77926.1 hypothetical protein SAMN04488699_11344 [Candidatus Frackibacter sp. WG13]
MKIQNKLKQDLNQILSKSNIKSSDSVKSKKSDFLDTLQEVHGREIKAKLDELLGLIDEQGERLSKKRTFKELVRYKKMVQKFVKEAVEKMYKVKEEYSSYGSGNHKVYTLVEKVDESLEELTRLVLDKQATQMEILDRLDEVRGMLVDIYS